MILSRLWNHYRGGEENSFPTSRASGPGIPTNSSEVRVVSAEHNPDETIDAALVITKVDVLGGSEL